MGGDSTTARAAVGPELLGRTLEECGNGVVITALTGNGPMVVWANREFERMTGWRLPELVDRPLQDILARVSDQTAAAEALRASIDGRDVRMVIRMPRAGGGWFWDQVHLTGVRGSGSSGGYSISVHTDVSERIEAEEQLRRSRDQALRRLEDFPSMVWRSEPGGARFHFNRLWCEFTGRLLEQEIDGGWEGGIHPDDLPRVCTAWEIAHRQRTGIAIEYRLRHRDGGWRWVSERGTPVNDQDGSYAGFLGACTDISVQKAAEEDARTSHLRLASIMESIAIAVIGLDWSGRVVFWNGAASRLFNVDQAATVGHAMRSLVPGIDWPAVDAATADLRPGDMASLEDLRFARSDGSTGTLAVRITADVGADVGGLLWSVSDVTERRNLERRLVQDQKLQSIGQLAAGIAHEINTPMQFVGDNTRFLSDTFTDLAALIAEVHAVMGEPASGLAAMARERLAAAEAKADTAFLLEEVPKAIAQSLDGITRVTRIVKAMKEFSHPGAEERTPVDINHAIESTTTVSRNEWKYVADLVLDLDPGLAPVPILPGGFNQVVLNLVVNAAHAIADIVRGTDRKGTITISTRDRGDQVEVRIGDTGTGIPEAIRSRIFDPFFTTKEVGRGTGQGLAIVRTEIVDKLGGTVDFATEAGKGTTFIISIPRSRGTSTVRRMGERAETA